MTELIYVHSKLLIADDNTVIIGKLTLLQFAKTKTLSVEQLPEQMYNFFMARAFYSPLWNTVVHNLILKYRW